MPWRRVTLWLLQVESPVVLQSTLPGKPAAAAAAVDAAIGKLTAVRALDGHGHNILAAATTLRESKGRDRVHALRSMCNYWA